MCSSSCPCTSKLHTGRAWYLQTDVVSPSLISESDIRRHPWHLNERFVVLVISSLRFGGLYGVLDVLQSCSKRAANAWPKQKVWLMSGNAVLKVLVFALLIRNHQGQSVHEADHAASSHPGSLDRQRQHTVRTMVLAKGSHLHRKSFSVSLQMISGRLTSRPFVINFARTNKEPLGFGFVFDLLALELLTLVAFEIPAAVFDAYSRQVSFYFSMQPLMIASRLLSLHGSRRSIAGSIPFARSSLE